MNNIIEKMRNPTSSVDLLNFLSSLGLNTHIIQAVDLPKKNINQILKNGCCILFEKNSEEADEYAVGHWTCLIKHPEVNALEYFDSYGRTPLRMAGFEKFYDNYKKKINMVYNPYEFQTNADSSACGRHVVLRLIFKDFPIDTYKKFMDADGIDDDYMATLYTKRF